MDVHNKGALGYSNINSYFRTSLVTILMFMLSLNGHSVIADDAAESALQQTQDCLRNENCSTPASSIAEIEPEIDELKNDVKLQTASQAVFLERSSQIVKGTSSDQKVRFSATKVTGKVHISFVLNGKEFLFIYESISFKKKELISIQLIPDSIEKNKKTKVDETILTQLFKELIKVINQKNPLEVGIQSSLDFLLGMLPNDEPFDKIDLRAVKKK
jgi:hypothetical protein